MRVFFLTRVFSGRRFVFRMPSFIEKDCSLMTRRFSSGNPGFYRGLFGLDLKKVEGGFVRRQAFPWNAASCRGVPGVYRAVNTTLWVDSSEEALWPLSHFQIFLTLNLVNPRELCHGSRLLCYVWLNLVTVRDAVVRTASLPLQKSTADASSMVSGGGASRELEEAF